MTLSPRTRRNDGWVNHTAYSARMHKFGAIRSLADEAEAHGLTGFWKGLGTTVLAIAAGCAVITGAFALRAEPLRVSSAAAASIPLSQGETK